MMAVDQSTHSAIQKSGICNKDAMDADVIGLKDKKIMS